MSVSIIIPNYNGANLLKRNLPAVFEAGEFYSKKSGEEVEIIIIDDGSTDNSIEISQKSKVKSQNYNLKFKILENQENLGFSSTVNKGVREASGEIVVLLNTDVAPKKDFLIPLIKHLDDTEIFAVGCLDKSIENGKIVLRGRGLGKWQRGFLVHWRGEVDKTNTFWVSGGSGAFRKSLWKQLGGLNELYNPFYWEDIDFSYRALKSGYKIAFEPKSIVIHEHEKGSIKSKYTLFQIKTIAYRNQFMFIWLNVTDLSLWFQHVLWLGYHFPKALLRLDFSFFLGFFKAILKLPEIAKERTETGKYFTKSDKDIVRNLNAE